MMLGPYDPPAAEPHFGTPTQSGYRFSRGWCRRQVRAAPSATCRAVNDWVSCRTGSSFRDCRTSASPARGEPGPVLRCVTSSELDRGDGQDDRGCREKRDRDSEQDPLSALHGVASSAGPSRNTHAGRVGTRYDVCSKVGKGQRSRLAGLRRAFSCLLRVALDDRIQDLVDLRQEVRVELDVGGGGVVYHLLWP